MIRGGVAAVLGKRTRGKHSRLANTGDMGVCGFGLEAHTFNGWASGVVLRKEDEGGVVGRGFGRGRVVDDGCGGREGSRAVGHEGGVRGDFEGSLGSCCRLMATRRDERAERSGLASGSEQLDDRSREKTGLHGDGQLGYIYVTVE